MKIRGYALVPMLVLSLVAGCGSKDAIETTPPVQMPQPTDALEPSAEPDQAAFDSTAACPPARGVGTVSPAISINSIVFAVNGVEQVVRDGDMLQAQPGEQVHVKEVTICAGFFSGDGGEACVDFAPVAQDGEEIASEHRGTHTLRLMPGFMTLSGPDQGWTVAENWRRIAAVLNHWPPVGTDDLGCGSGRCERDDRIIVALP